MRIISEFSEDDLQTSLLELFNLEVKGFSGDAKGQVEAVASLKT